MKQKEKLFYCYILFSKSIQQTYVGYTTDLEKRLIEHEENPTRTTARARDWRLVWYGVFTDRIKAENFEKYLKNGNGRIFMRKRLLGSLVKVNDRKE